MNLLLLQIEVAERGFDKVFDVSIALGICGAVIMGMAWYIMRLDKKAETKDEELKQIRGKREAELKDNISVMQSTQSTLQQIIQSNQNLPHSVERVIKTRFDEIVRILDKWAD